MIYRISIRKNAIGTGTNFCFIHFPFLRDCEFSRSGWLPKRSARTCKKSIRNRASFGVMFWTFLWTGLWTRCNMAKVILWSGNPGWGILKWLGPTGLCTSDRDGQKCKFLKKLECINVTCVSLSYHFAILNCLLPNPAYISIYHPFPSSILTNEWLSFLKLK